MLPHASCGQGHHIAGVGGIPLRNSLGDHQEARCHPGGADHSEARRWRIEAMQGQIRTTLRGEDMFCIGGLQVGGEMSAGVCKFARKWSSHPQLLQESDDRHPAVRPE